MAIKHTQKGFALLIAVIFMSVMLSLGLVLSSLAYKQEVLASNAVQSQYAFYAADAALECALYYDQQKNAFVHPGSDPGSAPLISCDGAQAVSSSEVWTATKWTVTERFSLDGNRCADITVYKPDTSVVGGTTYIFSQGYNVSCSAVSGPRTASRGIEVHY